MSATGRGEANPTLDAWIEEPPDLRTAIIRFAEYSGPEGFTVDDLRFAFRGSFPPNPGAILGSLCSHSRLRAIGQERSRLTSSKGRVVRRFAVVEDGLQGL